MQLIVDGRKVYAATGGRPFDASKPAAVFLHGAGCDHTVWQLPARWFAWHGYSVLAPDLPGHGRSEGAPLPTLPDLAHWLGRLLDASGAERVMLVGHSMGAAIALEAAAAVGARCTGIALIAAAGAIPVHKDLLAAAREEPERAYRMMTAWAHGPSAKLGGNPAPGVWMTGGTLALFARNRTGVLHADLQACAAWASGTDAARKLKCAALVVIAANDVMTPAKAGEELARLIAGSRSVCIPDCGHMLLSEAPDAVLDALIDFATPARAA
jgi:pimeloyl-ACP methyl ester carboxylesterase